MLYRYVYYTITLLTLIYDNEYRLYKCVSTVVEHSTHIPKIKGLNLAPVTWREKMIKVFQAIIILVFH